MYCPYLHIVLSFHLTLFSFFLPFFAVFRPGQKFKFLGENFEKWVAVVHQSSYFRGKYRLSAVPGTCILERTVKCQQRKLQRISESVNSTNVKLAVVLADQNNVQYGFYRCLTELVLFRTCYSQIKHRMRSILLKSLRKHDSDSKENG